MFGKISPNSSTPEEVCEYLRNLQDWRQVYLTEQVHINLGLTIAVTAITCPLTHLVQRNDPLHDILKTTAEKSPV